MELKGGGCGDGGRSEGGGEGGGGGRMRSKDKDPFDLLLLDDDVCFDVRTTHTLTHARMHARTHARKHARTHTKILREMGRVYQVSAKKKKKKKVREKKKRGFKNIPYFRNVLLLVVCGLRILHYINIIRLK